MLYFVLFLGLLVFFHEFGHFIVARMVGVRVVRLSIGFGPKIIGFKRGGTEYWISALPLGGYVKLFGDDPDEPPPSTEARQGFFTTDLWRRVLIVLAGPVFSLVLPVLVFLPMFLADSELPPSLLGSVAKGGPAWNAGLRPGDRVVEADGREVRYFWQVQAAVEGNPGRPFEVTVERDGTRQTHTVTPASVDDPMLRDLGFSSASGRIEVTLESSRPVAQLEPGGAVDRALSDFLALVRQVRVFDEPVAPRVIAVLAVNGREPTGWEDVAKAMEVARVRPVRLRVAPTSDVPDDIGPIAEVTLGPVPDDERIGLSDGAPVVVRVEPGSPAERAGMRPGDRIAAVDGKPFAGWLFMIQDLEKAPDAERTFAVVRAGGERADLRLSLRNPDWTPGAAVPKYAFGAANRRAVVDPDLVPNEDRLVYATVKTVEQTGRVFVVTVAAIGGLFTGRVSVREMGGPIMIYQIASTTGKRGWGDFFNAMAWLSMSIGILNLLPVPVLDGGNLVMFGIEAVRRRPVGRRGWQVARFFGVAFLMLLMVLVFTNDFGRLGAMMDMK